MSDLSGYPILRPWLVASSVDCGVPFLKCCRLTVAVGVKVHNSVSYTVIMLKSIALGKYLLKIVVIDFISFFSHPGQ